MTEDELYSELYDPKRMNVKVRPRRSSGLCSECKKRDGHEYTCSKVTIESMVTLVRQSRENEENIRGKAERWLTHLRRVIGKLALLKHENNKLRKANEKLRKENAQLRVVDEPDNDVERFRDEKRGLYGEHEDLSN